MKKKFGSLSLLVLGALAGCGGGGDDSGGAPLASAASAQGLWNGATSTNRTVAGLVLSDGTYYVFYSSVGNPTLIAGVIQGSGTSSVGTFSSSNARDFNLEGSGVLPATIASNFAAKQSFGGTIGYSATVNTTFTSTYDAAYEIVPSLAIVAGSFTGQVASSAGTQSSSLTVSANGAVSGASSGCATTGTVSPRSDGNAYDVSLTFGPSPCLFASQTLTGIAYFNATTKRLYAFMPNAARSDGLIFAGNKL